MDPDRSIEELKDAALEMVWKKSDVIRMSLAQCDSWVDKWKEIELFRKHNQFKNSGAGGCRSAEEWPGLPGDDICCGDLWQLLKTYNLQQCLARLICPTSSDWMLEMQIQRQRGVNWAFLDDFLCILSSTFSLFDALRCSEKLVDLVVMITNKLDTQVTADVCV